MIDKIMEFVEAIKANDLTKILPCSIRGFDKRKSDTYFFVGLDSNKSGCVIPKGKLHAQISNKSLSYSQDPDQYKINNYNLKPEYCFSSINEFFHKIGPVN